MNQHKICNVCGIDKPLAEFYKKKSSNDGHYSRCKSCQITAADKWQKKNRKAHNQSCYKYQDAHRDSYRIAAKLRARKQYARCRLVRDTYMDKSVKVVDLYATTKKGRLVYFKKYKVPTSERF